MPKPLSLSLGIALFAAVATAQTTISLSFTGLEETISLGNATGTLTPFGAASLVLSGGPISETTDSLTFVFTFANHDTLTATGTGDLGETTVTGTATIMAATGNLAGTTGSFNFVVTVDLSTDPNPFTVTGSGTVTNLGAGNGSLPTVVCESSGGSTLPIAPEHTALSNASSGPVCSVIVCEGGIGGTLPISPERTQAVSSPRAAVPGGGTCSNIGLDLAEVPGGATLPVLVFEGGGSTSPVLAFLACCGGTGGTLPVLTFEGGGSTLPVLASEGGGSTLPIAPDHRASTSTPSGTPLEIAVPLQSIASTYAVTAQCNGTPATCWLNVPITSGTIAASSRAAITAYVNPQGQNPGVYTGTVAITINPAGGPLPPSTLVTVPVTMLVPPNQPSMALSQNGIAFRSLNGAGNLSQSVVVANQGPGTLAFSAAATAPSGGNWLSVSPSSGTATASAPSTVTIRANAAGLAAGTYFGRVDFNPSGIANAAQSVEVSLTVLPPTATPDATLSATSLVFVAGKTPPQTLQVANPSSRAFTVSANIAMARGTGWLSANASALTVSPSQSLTETVTVSPAGLAAGVYVGTLGLHIAETNTDHMVTILLVVPKPSPCTATQLLPVITNLEGAFQIAAGFPAPVQAQVVDDCGVPLSTGSVTAYFPLTGDPSANLISLGQGQWSGTWMPHLLTGGAATVGIMASGASVFGSTGITGTLTANPNVPMAFAGGTVNAASIVVAPIAPGSFFSVFGANLATELTAQPTFPYTTTLGGTQALLGGEPLPLEVTVNGQINAVMPYDAAINGFQQLIIERNGMDSMPESLLLAPSQPAVFTLNQSGKGAGAIIVVKADNTQFINGPSHPALAGDFLTIYSTGLGAVSPPVAAGSAAPTTTYTNTVNPATVTIGGKSAQVFFAGLSPGYSGLYQVNVQVPTGIAPGTAVPLVVTVDGASSPPVTVVIQ